jgi:hypothetical protein
METNEPFVVVWRAQTQTSVKVRNECFKRVRVHHPNALVFVVWEEGVSDFSFVDERCSVCDQVCGSDYEAWKLFYEMRVGDSGLLLRDNLFVGSKPFPPFTTNQFFWTQTDLPGLFELHINDRSIRVEIPTYLFMGYLRRSCLSDHFFRTGPHGLSYGLKDVVSITFPNERPIERISNLIDDLVRLDLPAMCLITL